MSVEGEILRIQNNIAQAYAAVSNKGGTVPAQPTSANLPAAINSISAGGGSDGNPIGTVISFMGTSAPVGYLVCDGSQYNISDYPSISSHFLTQFGSSNYFGGDGETTFAVPDMRNLFLRGYHGEAEEHLSGDVGEKQEGTSFPAVFGLGGTTAAQASVMSRKGNLDPVMFEHQDTYLGNPTVYNYFDFNKAENIVESGANIFAERYTSRPVNMAVLFCIKAV